ncbi:MAG: metal ABC transporter ATP-binding protein [Nitrososphaeraceae archaeon]
MNAIEVNNLSYRFGSNSVLEDISFIVEEGDILGLIGPNGAGKTTLFSSMLGLLHDYDGSIKIFGEDIRKSKKMLKNVGYIQQKRAIETSFPATVEEIISLGVSGPSSKERIISALTLVDLYGQRNRRIGELSGGQQQRTLIAKAFVNNPRLLILDEPATGIDQEAQNKFHHLLEKLNLDNKITIVWASHDLDSVLKLANKVACLNRKMFFHGNTDEFIENVDALSAYSESTMQMHMHKHSPRP